jgi:hypothetical protein
MKRLFVSVGGAALVALAVAATALAAGPMGGGNRPADAGTVVPAVLGMTQAELQELRRDGLSLAQIAARQQVDPQDLIDALVARWTERIAVRVENGGLTEAQATELRAQLQARATDLVNRTAPGGMQGAAVGAGPHGAGGGPGPGSGSGTCDGSGPRGHGRS